MKLTVQKFLRRLFLTIVLIILALPGVHADSTPQNLSALTPEPWEKLSFTLGAFLSNTTSGVRVGTGLGLDINVEDLLGMEDKTTVARAEAFWRFSQNRKHRLDASWFALRRSATRKVGQDFDIKDRNGNTVTVQAGSEVNSHFNLDIIETAYSYSFIQDDRLDLALSGGVYVMPIDFGLTSTGATNADETMKFTAPLPVVGLRMDVALTPKWYIRTGSQFFYIQYQNFTGSLTQLRAAVEYLPFKHFGVGLGVDTMRFNVEATRVSDPNIDFKGNVDFRYTGLQLYGKLRF